MIQDWWPLGLLILAVIVGHFISMQIQINTLKGEVHSLQQIHDQEWRECFGPMAERVAEHEQKITGEVLPRKTVRGISGRKLRWDR